MGERLGCATGLGLGTKPGFRLANERTELAEQLGGGSVGPVERLDPVEPSENCACFVHAAERTCRRHSRL